MSIGTGWINGAWDDAGWVVGAWINTADANIGGNFAFTEAQLIAGGEQTTITLIGDTWAVAGGTFDAIRQDIINGFNSAQSEVTGWNAVIRDLEVITSVVRTSDTVVTITWSASPTYNVTADETITVTVPASALGLGLPVVGTPVIVVTSDIIGHLPSGRNRVTTFTNLNRGLQ